MSRAAGSSRPIDRVDLAWAGHWGAIVVTPMHVAAVETIRAKVLELLVAHPATPLACRVDLPRRRWRPVPAGERTAHVAALVRTAPDPADKAIAAHVNAHRPPDDLDLPFVAVVGSHTLTVFLNHVYGDAVTFASVVHAFVDLDFVGLVRQEPRFTLRRGWASLLRADRRSLCTWWGEGAGSVRRSLLARLRWNRRGIGSAPAAVGGSGGSSPVVVDATCVGVLLEKAAVRELLRRRNESAAGASVTALLASRVHGALLAEGVPVHDGGFFTLFDARQQLPSGYLGHRVSGHISGNTSGTMSGNLAKSLFLAAPMADPARIDAAIKGVLRSRRTVPAIVAEALATAIPPRRAGRRIVPSQSFVLTFNSMPALPWINTVPWRTGGPRRIFIVGLASQPGSVSVFVTRNRDGMEVTASFDRNAIDERGVLAALHRLVPGTTRSVGAAARLADRT